VLTELWHLILICTIVGGVITSILKHLARKAGTSEGPIQVLHTICRNIKATTYLQINANTYLSQYNSCRITANHMSQDKVDYL